MLTHGDGRREFRRQNAEYSRERLDPAQRGDDRDYIEGGVGVGVRLVGLPLFLGARTAPGRAFTQIGGDGYVIEAETFVRYTESLPRLRSQLQRYTQGFVTQVSQSVACNRLHPPVQRLARWLLSCADRVGAGSFPMTQEFMGQMLGVRRATVGEAAQELQERGLIRYSRGTLSILDRAALESAACVCYRIVRDEFDKLLGTPAG